MILFNWLASVRQQLSLSRFFHSSRQKIRPRDRRRHFSSVAAMVEVMEPRRVLSAVSAMDDSFAMQTDDAMLSPVTLDVASNDYSQLGSLTITNVGSVTHGSVTIQSTDPYGSNSPTLLYTPEAGYSGTESFSYTVSDTDGDQATATVTVSVTISSSFWDTPAGLSILVAIDAANATYEQTVAANQVTADTANQSATDQYDSTVQAASDTQSANDQAAEDQFNSDLALASATQDSADQATAQAEGNVESSAAAAESASNQSAQNLYNSAVSSAGQTQAAADNTSWTTYQGVKNSASATMAATQAAASAARESAMEAAYAAYQSAQNAAAEAWANATSSGSGSGSGGGSFDLWQDSGFLSAVASAQATASQAEASASVAYTSATDTAWTTYQAGAQPAQDTYNSAIAANQATYDASVASAQATYDAAIAAAQAAYNVSEAAASDAKFQILLQNLAAHHSAVSAANDAYQSAIAADQAAYDASSGAAWNTLQSALASEQTTYDSAVAAGQLTLSTALANAETAYDTVANNPGATVGDLANALTAYEGTVGGAYQADILLEATTVQPRSNNDAAAQNAYRHAIDAATAAQQANDAAAAYTKALAINSADQAQLLADTAAATAYQIQLNSFAETQAISDAAADLALSLAINGALAAQSTSDGAAANTLAHTLNGLTQQYNLEYGDASTAYTTAVTAAETQEQVEIDNAAASAWTDWASSSAGGDPYATYEAANQAASYTYDAAVATANGSASIAFRNSESQWAHDVSGGWLTYRNDMADHARTAADATAAAATSLTNTIAANANTFVTTMAPAIRAAADAQVNDGNQAIIAASSAALIDANTNAANALSATNARISAEQAVNDAFGDAAAQGIGLDSAAEVVFAGVRAGIIGQFVTQAQTGTSALQNTSNQQAAINLGPANRMSKQTFTQTLTTLINNSGISHKKLPGLWRRDTNSQVFCCADFRQAIYNYLLAHFEPDSGCTMLLIDTSYARTTNVAGGHALLVVQRGTDYWLVDPVAGQVVGTYTSMAALITGMKAYLVTNYQAVDTPASPIAVIGPFTMAEYCTNNGQYTPFYEKPASRAHFDAILRKNKIDPEQFYPPVPPYSVPDPGYGFGSY